MEFVARGKGLGMSLDEITELLALLHDDECRPVQDRMKELLKREDRRVAVEDRRPGRVHRPIAKGSRPGWESTHRTEAATMTAAANPTPGPSRSVAGEAVTTTAAASPMVRPPRATRLFCRYRLLRSTNLCRDRIEIGTNTYERHRTSTTTQRCPSRVPSEHRRQRPGRVGGQRTNLLPILRLLDPHHNRSSPSRRNRPGRRPAGDRIHLWSRSMKRGELIAFAAACLACCLPLLLGIVGVTTGAAGAVGLWVEKPGSDRGRDRAGLPPLHGSPADSGQSTNVEKVDLTRKTS